MTSMLQGRADQRFVCRRRRRNDQRIHIVAREDIVETFAGRDRTIALLDDRKTIRALVADDGQFGIWQVVQNARVIRSPVSEPDECEANALPVRAAVVWHEVVEQ
jgi:hypothetical protein